MECLHKKPLDVIDPCLGKRRMVSSMPRVKTLKLPTFQVDA